MVQKDGGGWDGGRWRRWGGWVGWYTAKSEWIKYTPNNYLTKADPGLCGHQMPSLEFFLYIQQNLYNRATPLCGHLAQVLLYTYDLSEKTVLQIKVP